MKSQEDKPYLEKKTPKETTKEQLIYGGGETLKEVNDRKEKLSKELLTE